MKKLMTLMLGAAMVFTAVAVTFAQDTTKKSETTKKSRKGKTTKTTTDTTKTGGDR
jgi:hypothetical protein